MEMRAKTIGYALLCALLAVELIAFVRLTLNNRAASDEALALATPRPELAASALPRSVATLPKASFARPAGGPMAPNSSAFKGQADAPAAPLRHAHTAAGMHVATPFRPIVKGAYDFARDGTWEVVDHLFDGRRDGQSVRSFHPGASATLQFVGRAVRLYGVVGRGGGLANVELDGKFVRTVSFYATQKNAHRLLFASTPLRPGTHHLKISVLYEATGLTARRHYVNIDSAEVIS